MDIASPWDHRVYEMEGEKTEKYQDLRREAGAKAFIYIILVITNDLLL